MAATLDELLKERTIEEEEALLLSIYQANGFPVTDWRVGGVARTMSKAVANAMLDKSGLLKTIASGGLVNLAKKLPDKTWLKLIGENFYDLAIAAPTYTKQRCVVACTAGAGPQTVTSGFIVKAPATGNRYIYQGTVGVNVPDNGEAAIEFTAESPGAKYADAADTITEIVTVLPGLSVTNPKTDFGGTDPSTSRAIKSGGAQGTGHITPSGSPVTVRSFIITVLTSGTAGTSGKIRFEAIVNGVRSTIAEVSPIPTTYAGLGDGITLAIANGTGAGFIVGDIHTFQTPGTPITNQGTDEESAEAYAARLIGRWPSLSQNAVSDKYVNWIKQCSIDNGFGIEKITIRPSLVEAGVADVLVATASGAPSGPTITALQNYVNARDGIVDRATIVAASNRNISIGGDVTVKASELVAVQAAADANWQAYIASLPIGGDVQTGTPGVVRLGELWQAIYDAGAVDTSGLFLVGAADNLAILYNEVAVIPAGQLPSQALTWNTVL